MHPSILDDLALLLGDARLAFIAALLLAAFGFLRLREPARDMIAYILLAATWLAIIVAIGHHPKALVLGYGAISAVLLTMLAYLTSSANNPNIIFPKYALFWVEVEKNLYWMGVVTKYFNVDSQAYTVKGVTLSTDSITIFPRGNTIIRRLTQWQDAASTMADNYLKPGSEAYFKKLVPIRVDMSILEGGGPEFVLHGIWVITIDRRRISVCPQLYSFYERPLTLNQWEDLTKPQSAIKLEDLVYQSIPDRPPINNPNLNYLLFNADRGAKIEERYFLQTETVRSESGVMVFVRGRPRPPLGWSVLGQTYFEVWSNPEKLALYNSVYPPGEDGLPRAFGFFAGLENEMAGPMDRALSAPTTRAEIYEINVPVPAR